MKVKDVDDSAQLVRPQSTTATNFVCNGRAQLKTGCCGWQTASGDGLKGKIMQDRRRLRLRRCASAIRAQSWGVPHSGRHDHEQRRTESAKDYRRGGARLQSGTEAVQSMTPPPSPLPAALRLRTLTKLSALCVYVSMYVCVHATARAVDRRHDCPSALRLLRSGRRRRCCRSRRGVLPPCCRHLPRTRCSAPVHLRL